MQEAPHRVVRGFRMPGGDLVAGGKRVSSRRFKKLKREFFEEGKAQDAVEETRHLSVCWMCKDRIDYDALPATTDLSHALDHYYPVSTHPELQEDPANFRHSHNLCNAERSNRAPNVDLGEEIEAWW